MKISGIRRRIDALGRIVIPKEIRKDNHIKEGDQLEISSSSDNTITLKKYNRLGTNKDFINQFINSIKQVLNCDINIVNDEIIMYSTDNTKINKYYENNPNDIVYSINPNGDKVCDIVYVFHSKTVKYQSFIKELSMILQSFMEE